MIIQSSSSQQQPNEQQQQQQVKSTTSRSKEKRVTSEESKKRDIMVGSASPLFDINKPTSFEQEYIRGEGSSSYHQQKVSPSSPSPRQNSLPDSQRGDTDNNNFFVKVKTVNRKIQKLHKQSKKTPFISKQLQLMQQQKNSNDMKDTSGASYAGAASSPHIKPEYTNQRLRSPSNIMRARSIGQNAGNNMPQIEGKGIKQQTNQLVTAKIEKNYYVNPNVYYKDVVHTAAQNQDIPGRRSPVSSLIVNSTMEGQATLQNSATPITPLTNINQVLPLQPLRTTPDIDTAYDPADLGTGGGTTKNLHRPRPFELELDMVQGNTIGNNNVNAKGFDVTTVNTAHFTSVEGEGNGSQPSSSDYRNKGKYQPMTGLMTGLTTKNQKQKPQKSKNQNQNSNQQNMQQKQQQKVNQIYSGDPTGVNNSQDLLENPHYVSASVQEEVPMMSEQLHNQIKFMQQDQPQNSHVQLSDLVALQRLEEEQEQQQHQLPYQDDSIMKGVQTLVYKQPNQNIVPAPPQIVHNQKHYNYKAAIDLAQLNNSVYNQTDQTQRSPTPAALVPKLGLHERDMFTTSINHAYQSSTDQEMPIAAKESMGLDLHYISMGTDSQGLNQESYYSKDQVDVPSSLQAPQRIDILQPLQTKSNQQTFSNQLNAIKKSKQQQQQQAQQHMRTKSVFSSQKQASSLQSPKWQNKQNNLIESLSLAQQTSQEYLQHQQKVMAAAGSFKLVAERKQVVVNQRAEIANYQRKLNAMSKNEQKRQASLLKNLPLILQQQQQSLQDKMNGQRTQESIFAQDNEQSQLSKDEPQRSIINQTELLQRNNRDETVGTNEMVTMNDDQPAADLVNINPEAVGQNMIKYRQMTCVDSQMIQQEDVVEFEQIPPQTTMNLTKMSMWDQNHIQIGAKNLTTKDIINSSQQHIMTFKDVEDETQRLPISVENYQQFGAINQRRTNTSNGMTKSMAMQLRQNQMQTSPNLQAQSDMQYYYQPPRSSNQNAFSTQIKYNTQTGGFGIGDAMFSDNFTMSQIQMNQKLPKNTSSFFRNNKFFDRRSQSKSHQNMSGISSVNKRYKSQQRQIKGLQNLGELQSSHINGIKISRLNDLGNKEDGNPLAQFNRLKEEEQVRVSSLYSGGEQTKNLARLIAEAKFQAEAIQDFSCKASLFNKTQGFQPPKKASAIMPLKKLIGKQSIILPPDTKLLIDDSKVENNKRFASHIANQASKVNDSIMRDTLLNHSRDSIDKMSITMMRQLLNDNNYASGGTMGGQSQNIALQNHVFVQGRNISQTDVIDKECDGPTENLADDGTVDQNGHPLLIQLDTFRTNDNDKTISPKCQKIKFQQKDQNLRQKTTQEVANRTRQKVQRARARTQTLSETSQGQQRVHQSQMYQNRDMEEMIGQYQYSPEKIQNEQEVIMLPKQASGVVAVTPENKGELMTQNSRQKIQNNKSHKSVELQELSKNRDSSDDGTGGSGGGAALYPVGILDLPLTPTQDASNRRGAGGDYERVISHIKSENEVKLNGSDGQKLMTIQEKNTSAKKHQVYSHFEDSQSGMRIPNKVGEYNNSSSHPFLMQVSDQEKKANQSIISQVDSGDQSPLLPTRKVTGVDRVANNLTVNYGNTTPASIIGVKSVNIQHVNSGQKIKESNARNSRSNNSKTQTHKMDTSQGRAVDPIKHVDQSIDKEHESQATIIRQSYRESVAHTSPSVEQAQNVIIQQQQSDNRKKVITFERNQNCSNQEIRASNKDGGVQHLGLQEENYLPEDRRDGVVSRLIATHQGSRCDTVATKVEEQLENNRHKKTTKGQHPGGQQRSTNQPNNVLEQISVINQIEHQHTGYHQLEPKLFPSNTRAIEQARLHSGQRSTDTSILVADGVKTNSISSVQQQQVPPPKEVVNQKLQSKKVSGYNMAKSDVSSLYTKSAYHARQSSPDDGMGHNVLKDGVIEEEEMSVIQHQAIGGRFQSQRQSQKLVEIKKRQMAKARTHLKSVDQQQTFPMSSQNNRKRGVGASQSRQRPRLNSIADMSILQSKFASTVSGGLSSINSYPYEDPVIVADQKIRKINTLEKDFSKCINLESRMQTPIENFWPKLEVLISTSMSRKIGSSDSLLMDNSPITETYSPVRLPAGTPTTERGDSLNHRPRKMLTKLNSLLVAKLYRDHLKYEFRTGELYKLLGENLKAAQESSKQRRYFLKFTSIQIVNLDCQSGIFEDLKPISIPFSKMTNLFFLSKDQLQQVLAKSFTLRKENGRIQLSLDQNRLRTSTYEVIPRVIREDFFSAPLKLSLTEELLEGHALIKDQFNLQIRMPRFEIITTAENTSSSQTMTGGDAALYKTTMTHSLTGRQMLMLAVDHGVMNWVQFAQMLIKERVFGVDQHADENGTTTTNNWVYSFNEHREFKLYKDPTILAKQEQIARNLQLTLDLSNNSELKVEFLQPLYLKLKNMTQEIQTKTQQQQQEEEDQEELIHLPGYLPQQDLPVVEIKKKKKQTTIARLHIPYTKLAYIRQTFGDKVFDDLASGQDYQGSFMQCLYQTVQVMVDSNKNLCRLSVPRWKQLEDQNLRQISQKYFHEQQLANKAQDENLKYLQRQSKGGVKQILQQASTSFSINQASWKKQQIVNSRTHALTSKSSINHKKSVFAQEGSQVVVDVAEQLAIKQRASVASMTSPLLTENEFTAKEDQLNQQQSQNQASVKIQLIELNSAIQAKLKVGTLSKLVYLYRFNDDDQAQDNQQQQPRREQIKLTLDEYLAQLEHEYKPN